MDAARCGFCEEDAVRSGHAESSRHAECITQHTGRLLPPACVSGVRVDRARFASGRGQTARMSPASTLLRLGAGALAALLAFSPSTAGGADPLAPRRWTWPVTPVRIVQPFVAPAHEYGAGHRGLDLDDGDGAVRSPADGRVAFAGPVAGRGVLTIDHGDGLVSSFEPVDTELAVGAAVRRGQIVARVGVGGHTAPGELHVGVRLEGEYINPLRLLGGVPRAVLLPCC